MSGYDDSSYGDSSYDDSSYGDSDTTTPVMAIPVTTTPVMATPDTTTPIRRHCYDDSDTTTLLRRLQLRRLRSSHDDSSYGLSYPGYKRQLCPAVATYLVQDTARTPQRLPRRP